MIHLLSFYPVACRFVISVQKIFVLQVEERQSKATKIKSPNGFRNLVAFPCSARFFICFQNDILCGARNAPAFWNRHVSGRQRLHPYRILNKSTFALQLFLVRRSIFCIHNFHTLLIYSTPNSSSPLFLTPQLLTQHSRINIILKLSGSLTHILPGSNIKFNNGQSTRRHVADFCFSE